jgi:hypothetical protein
MPENNIVTFEPDGIKALLRAQREFSAVANGDSPGDIFEVIMPNGKQLGDCTREDILAYAELTLRGSGEIVLTENRSADQNKSESVDTASTCKLIEHYTFFFIRAALSVGRRCFARASHRQCA